MTLAAWNINRTDYGLGLAVEGADDTLSLTLQGDLKKREDEDVSARLVVLESADAVSWKRLNFPTPSSFEAAIAQGRFPRTVPLPRRTETAQTPVRNDEDTRVNRIYVLESALLRTGFTALLKSHLSPPSALFAEQQRSTTPIVGSDRLASILADRNFQGFIYPQLVALPAAIRNCFWLRCSATGREVATTRILGEFHQGAVSHRRCSIWRRLAVEQRAGEERTVLDGWDVLVLTDPELQAVRASRDGQDMQVGDYVRTNRLRYANFLDEHSESRPPNTSMLDDLCFFLEASQTNSAGNPAFDSPALIRVLCAKIVASHYTLLAEYVESILCNAHFRMSRQQDMSVFDVFMAESQWSDVHAYHNRVRRFATRLEAIMLQLDIPLQGSDSLEEEGSTRRTDGTDYGWTNIRHDYPTLHHKFARLYVGVEHLNSSITGLVSIAGNRQALADQKLSLAATERSIREARSAKALTSVGLVFIPLAYMSSLFSMSAPFGPGGSMFWLYFVVSLPLVAVVVGGYWLVDLGYGDEGIDCGREANWSLRTLIIALKWAWSAKNETQRVRVAEAGHIQRTMAS